MVQSVNGCFITLILFYVLHNDCDGKRNNKFRLVGAGFRKNLTEKENRRGKREK